MALFEVLIPSDEENFSAIVPSAAVRGTFWSANSAVATVNGQITAKLADNADHLVLGFNGREITTTGLPADAQILYMEGFEGYDAVGKECSLSPLPELMAVEDDTAHTYLDQTNPITAVNDLVNFDDGYARIAQSGEHALYKVVGVEAGVEDATKNRYILQRVPGGTKA